MHLKDKITDRVSDFLELCKTHQVKYMYAFGSSVRQDFNERSSDIDLLVEVDDKDPVGRGEKLLSLWDKLEEFFHRKVDLLTESSIKNPVLKKNIDATKILIYDGKIRQILI